MGVHNLWSIIEPIHESVPLYSLSGKTLAVDLSLWVCEAQHVQAMMGKVTKPHLRNLFFRVSSLTLMGIKLVFVMEGEAPKLKSETMSKRTEARYGGFKKASVSKSAKTTSRGRFNAVLRECAEMLDYLGVPWVTAAGEAEAMCAYLDSEGLVDGCITNDGDAFLYGAQTVYRNFNMSSKDPQVDCYRTTRLQRELHLTRENLVGLAILLGCDYIPKGIPGVGREQALRLIQTLKGQSLLQRFIQWREENTDASDGVVKKVPHCNICRHPGSAKAHERGGCVLCNSQRFCQPQDFDYQCPCDWHCYENTRQASSLEANIKRKVLASYHFPFTEIISEFLISKDTFVSHFKRRQPNMLLMQKFAFDKMEWPKHYTSEKVLVLMTYSELMNRKCGRNIPSQIKPIRILKPRVRNATACFEVVWGTPEHYVFPEDRVAEDQHEVRTVEEESLFRVAFPEIVESYIRSKAMAEENKTKKKKPRSKKEKSSDVSDGVSDLLAQMTLQSSPSGNPTTQPPSLPETTSSTHKTEVLILDTPLSQKQLRREKEDSGGPSNPTSWAESAAAASPSVSAVLDELHLSDIDWEALSFTSSPASQANRITEPVQKKTAVMDETRGESTEQESSDDAKQADSTSAPGPCDTECSLRDRVLTRNLAKYNGVSTNHLNYELASPDKESLGKIFGKSSSKNSNDRNVSENKSAHKEEETLSDKSLLKTGTKSSNEQQISALQAPTRAKEKSRSPHKYKFVKSALSSSFVPTQRCHSDPGQREKKSTDVPQTTKKSVCMSVCSSSEDSDAENQHSGPHRMTKTKPVNTIKSSFISDFPLKPISAPKTTKPNADPAHKPRMIGPILKSHVEVAENSRPAKNKYQVDDVFAQTPASPVILSDSDDSVSCDSPLPLAERLRLKFLK